MVTVYNVRSNNRGNYIVWGTLNEGGSIPSSETQSVNIRAEVEGSTIARVDFQVYKDDDGIMHQHSERFPEWVVFFFGNTDGNYYSMTLTPGVFRIVGTPYDASNVAGETYELSFTVV